MVLQERKYKNLIMRLSVRRGKSLVPTDCWETPGIYPPSGWIPRPDPKTGLLWWPGSRCECCLILLGGWYHLRDTHVCVVLGVCLCCWVKESWVFWGENTNIVGGSKMVFLSTSSVDGWFLLQTIRLFQQSVLGWRSEMSSRSQDSLVGFFFTALTNVFLYVLIY